MSRETILKTRRNLLLTQSPFLIRNTSFEDVLKTFLQDVLETSKDVWKNLDRDEYIRLDQDVFKTS